MSARKQEELMANNITAFGDKIVAKKIETKDRTDSGFYLPDSASKDDVKFAEVIAIGKDVKEVKIGDKIFYSNYSSPVKIDGNQYVYMKEEEVFFKLG